MQPEIPISELHDFVLTRAVDEPLTKRARIYRALASIIGSEADAAALLALAKTCDALDRDCQQMLLNFRAAKGGKGA